MRKSGAGFFFLSKGKVLKEINSQYDYRKKFFCFQNWPQLLLFKV